jgi:hypothetical protein
LVGDAVLLPRPPQLLEHLLLRQALQCGHLVVVVAGEGKVELLLHLLLLLSVSLAQPQPHAVPRARGLLLAVEGAQERLLVVDPALCFPSTGALLQPHSRVFLTGSFGGGFACTPLAATSTPPRSSPTVIASCPNRRSRQLAPCPNRRSRHLAVACRRRARADTSWELRGAGVGERYRTPKKVCRGVVDSKSCCFQACAFRFFALLYSELPVALPWWWIYFSQAVRGRESGGACVEGRETWSFETNF